MFRTSYVRNTVDPQVKDVWPGRAPWGDLRRTWKAEHCLRVSGTGYPDDCPYSKESCAEAFLDAVVRSVDAKRPMAMFRKVARWEGWERADNKPLARDSLPSGPSRDLPRQQVPRDLQRLLGKEESHLLARMARPKGIRDVLGTFDFGTRQVPPQDGREGVGRREEPVPRVRKARRGSPDDALFVSQLFPPAEQEDPGEDA